MDNNKGQTIFLSVIGIATLLVAIVGATFAWFSISVSGNANASSVIVTTAKLGSVEFTDGNLIELTNIRPETSPQQTKTFTVANTDAEATEDIEYKIGFVVSENTLSPVAAGAFVHSLTGVSDKSSNQGTVVPAITEQEVPTTSTILGNGVLKGYEKHTYTYTIQFKETSKDQNAAQGAKFGAKIQVALKDGTIEGITE